MGLLVRSGARCTGSHGLRFVEEGMCKLMFRNINQFGLQRGRGGPTGIQSLCVSQRPASSTPSVIPHVADFVCCALGGSRSGRAKGTRSQTVRMLVNAFQRVNYWAGCPHWTVERPHMIGSRCPRSTEARACLDTINMSAPCLVQSHSTRRGSAEHQQGLSAKAAFKSCSAVCSVWDIFRGVHYR